MLALLDGFYVVIILGILTGFSFSQTEWPAESVHPSYPFCWFLWSCRSKKQTSHVREWSDGKCTTPSDLHLVLRLSVRLSLSLNYRFFSFILFQFLYFFLTLPCVHFVQGPAYRLVYSYLTSASVPSSFRTISLSIGGGSIGLLS